MGKPFDATLKAMLEESPGDWPVLAGLPCGEATVIDADVSTVSGAADKVLRIRGTPDWLTHVEFQAGPDATLPRRMFLDNALLDDRHGLMVRSVAVLLRPEANLANLTGRYERRFAAEEAHATFRYWVVRVWEFPPETLLTAGLGLLPLAPISAVAEPDLPGVVERMKQRLHSRRLRNTAARLWTATYVLVGMRYSEAMAARLLEGVIGMEESVTYQAIVRKGLQQGLQQGRVEEARKMVLLMGEARFGPPTPRTLAVIEAIDELTKLEQLPVRLVQASSWEELLDLPASASRSRRRKPKA
jgi:predicted transposase YdaD